MIIDATFFNMETSASLAGRKRRLLLNGPVLKGELTTMTTAAAEAAAATATPVARATEREREREKVERSTDS